MEQFLPELVDALGVIVDNYVHENRLAEAAQVLSEAAYVLDQLPNDATSHLVLQNLAVTYTHCGFVEAALELYDRALRLADTDLDRHFTYSNLASAYHYAAQREPDPERKARFLRDGIYAAGAAIDPQGAGEALSVASALVSPMGDVGPTGPIPKSKPHRIAAVFFSGTSTVPLRGLCAA